MNWWCSPNNNNNTSKNQKINKIIVLHFFIVDEETTDQWRRIEDLVLLFHECIFFLCCFISSSLNLKVCWVICCSLCWESMLLPSDVELRNVSEYSSIFKLPFNSSIGQRLSQIKNPENHFYHFTHMSNNRKINILLLFLFLFFYIFFYLIFGGTEFRIHICKVKEF